VYSDNLKNVTGLEKIDDLKLTSDEYIIGASAACIVLGFDAVNNDLDLCVDKKNSVVLDKIKNADDVLDFGIDENNTILNFDEYFKYSHIVGGYRFLNKEGLIKFYKTLVKFYPKEKYFVRLEWLQNIK
jgi:hypothetical protein